MSIITEINSKLAAMKSELDKAMLAVNKLETANETLKERLESIEERFLDITKSLNYTGRK